MPTIKSLKAHPSGKSWFKIQAKAAAPVEPDEAEPDSADVFIYDEIGGWGITAGDFVAALKGLNVKTLNVRINSPGGSVFDGVAIHNALKAHPATVNTFVDGVAASIASIVALAGDAVNMAEHSFMMIHNPWACTMGDAAELRQTADLLDKISGTIASIYAAKTGFSLADMQALMDAETWFTAAEAKEGGFIDCITPKDGAAEASFDFSLFKNVPKALAKPKTPAEPADSAPEVNPEVTPEAAPDLAKKRRELALRERF